MPKIKSVRKYDKSLKYHNWNHQIMQEDDTRYDFIELESHSGIKIYCSRCKEGFVEPHSITTTHLKMVPVFDDANHSKIGEKLAEEEIPVGYKCPTCGKIGHLQNCLRINQMENEIHSNEYPIWAEVIDDGPDSPLVKFRWIINKYSGWNDKLQVESRFYYLVFNTVTGNTFYFTPLIKSNGSNKTRKAPWYQGPSIKNVNYYVMGEEIFPDKIIPLEIRIKLYNCIYEKICKNLGYSPKRIEDYYQDYEHDEDNKNKFAKSVRLIDLDEKVKFLFQDIIFYNRQPNLNTVLYKHLIRKSRRRIAHKKKTLAKFTKEHKQWKEEVYNAKKNNKRFKKQEPWLRSYIVDNKIASIKNTDPNPIGTLMKNFKIKQNNSFRKIILNNYCDIFRLHIILDYFKDINNVRKLMDANMFSHIDYFPWKSKKYNLGYYNNFKLESEFFIKEMINKFGETMFVNKIVNGYSSHFRDTAEMYCKLRLKKVFEISYLDKIKICYTKIEADNFIIRQENKNIQCSIKIIDIPINLNGNLTEIHDRLFELSDMLDHPNEILRDSYNEEELKLECETEDYIIKLTDDTHELRQAGRTMHICVGSYGDRVVKGQCNIVLMINKSTNNYVMCLELSSDFKNIYQAKAECNYYPEGKEKEVITKWIEEHKLIVKTNDLPELCVEDAGYYRARQRPQVNENGLNLAAVF